MVPNSGSAELGGASRRRSIRIDATLLSAPEEQSIVFEAQLDRRDGSVMARSTILKSDHFGAGRELGADLKILGAPNFRQANLNVFGAAQPTVTGLAAILRLLRCGPSAVCRAEQTCTWFSTREEPLIYINGRPFVLRDRQLPFENIRSYAGITAARLEQMEARLKADILEEASRNNGVLLVHDEVEEHQIVPCLTAIESVRTSAEIFADMQDAGFCIDYKRVPVSHEQAPTDAYIDDYVRLFHAMPTANHAVIFSCGIGVGRTTYAMVIGLLLRRVMILRDTGDDPLVIEQKSDEDRTTRIILKLISLLEQCLQGNAVNRSAIEWTLARGNLIDNLKAAILGNYHVIIELVRVLDQGVACKRIVDETIDKCEALLNIREHILINRVKHSLSEESNSLESGVGYLERYFSLIAFCAYIGENHDSTISFSAWIKDRRDIWNMLQNLRKNTDKLRVFRPVDDLAVLTAHQRSSSISCPSPYLRVDDLAESNVIKSRAGSVLSPHTILKIDHWNPEERVRTVLAGAPNFRQISGKNIYATAQPTLSALRAIVGMIYGRLGGGEGICWINIREEPLVYIEDEPYVLRDRYATLRNIKSYSGITADRLEQMEKRLKEDILSEAAIYSNKLLVHCESSSKTVYPSWVTLDSESKVMTLREIFDQLSLEFPRLVYRRLPVTAEEPPEPEHFDEILKMMVLTPPNKCHIIFNCQMGASRSTTGAVTAGLVLRWQSQEHGFVSMQQVNYNQKSLHYKIVHSILRVIKNGLECKAIVDGLIDETSAAVNLRDCIEEYRLGTESSSDPVASRRALRKGMAALKRYVYLILFQAYLMNATPDEDMFHLETFSSWLGRHQEFRILMEDVERKGGVVILHEDHLVGAGEGVAPTFEVLDVVKNRKGSVLATMTILKFDHFPGCQKMSLSERIDGAPNFREVSLGDESCSVFGLAMPTKQGVRMVLNRIGRRVLWFCLREEPVVYVNGRPYVLRIVKDPIVNLEMTGIVSERVELMEKRLKDDLLAELEAFSGKVLLHEEDDITGDMVPVWEAADPENIETTAEIMEKVREQNYPVEYVRIPITDEQAPIPEVFDHLLRLVWDQSPGLPSANPIFNCQMGRGRTTTGMVITVLLHLARNKHLVPSPELVEGESPEDLSLNSDMERERYLAGEYKIVLQLVQVLEHGKLSKRLVDAATDRCAHIQNLRTAVYNFKLRSGGELGLNYLLRYFFLIVFAEYLVEMHAGEGVQKSPPEMTFVKWLEDRREITNMVARRDLVDFS